MDKGKTSRCSGKLPRLPLRRHGFPRRRAGSGDIAIDKERFRQPAGQRPGPTLYRRGFPRDAPVQAELRRFGRIHDVLSGSTRIQRGNLVSLAEPSTFPEKRRYLSLEADVGSMEVNDAPASAPVLENEGPARHGCFPPEGCTPRFRCRRRRQPRDPSARARTRRGDAMKPHRRSNRSARTRPRPNVNPETFPFPSRVKRTSQPCSVWKPPA